MDSIRNIWILAVVVNLFFLYAVFESKFQSPLVQVHRSHRGQVSSGIQRVVFFSADGLRASSFFEHPERHPRLTHLMEHGLAQWGISDTRVPTESRPGHIALFAGFYEDPSAIFTGWQNNLVDFDTVFNQSDYIVALGSPDVINMFAKGIGEKKFYSDTYPSHYQDFFREDSTVLDSWVLKKFTKIIKDGNLPNNEKLIVFLHLLGIDNTGHHMKPRSESYKANIAYVDSIVSTVEDLVENYFADNNTLFVFASDHGMTDWGSHGDGSSHETETPFVVWGPGIRGSLESTRLKQADFASLIGGGLGINFPTNSVGRFPAGFWTNRRLSFDALSTNLRQLYELMLAKKRQVMQRSFGILLYSGEKEIDSILEETHSENRNRELNWRRLDNGISLLLEGINYYERYDQTLLASLTVTAFAIWIAIIGMFFLQEESDLKLNLILPRYFVFTAALSWGFIKGAVGWPLWRVPYTLFPLYLGGILYSLERSRRRPYADIKILVGLAMCSFIVSEILVLAFYRREILTLGLALCALWWMRNKRLGTWQGILWIGSIAILGIFPTMPVIGSHPNSLLVMLGTITSGSGAILLLMLRTRSLILPNRDRLVLCLQIGLLFAVPILKQFPDAILTRALAWSSIALSFLAPIYVSSVISLRILSIFLAVGIPFSFLSLSYESLFLPSLFAVLIHLLKLEIMENGESWEAFFDLGIENEQVVRDSKNAIDDIHRSFRLGAMHLFFVFFSFFGIGNIGSVSSFDPSAVQCFLSVFNPFVMMLMLLQKIMAPFLLVASIFRLLLFSKAQVQKNFLIVLFLSQCMGLHMFMNVTNLGSWKEIGTSISHYVIAQCITFFVLLLYVFANFLTSEIRVRQKNRFPLFIAQQKVK